MLGLLLLVLAGPPAGAADVYQPEARVEYLTLALDAVRATDAKTQEQAYKFIGTLEATSCASQFERLAVECLIAGGRRFCKTRPKSEAKSCPLVTDVVISNVLAEKEHLSNAERYEIMREHQDYRVEMTRQVRRIQAAIAADFELRTSAGTRPVSATLTRRIDRYCLNRADETDLSWQSCAAGLVWFIGTQESGAP